MADQQHALAVFNDTKIRRVWHENEWWFSVVDVIQALEASSDARNYWKVLKHRLNNEGSQAVTFCNQLKLPAADGKVYKTDCSNTEGLFRIIQSIPSPKAEPFKLWLAKLGYERVQEIEDPERAQQRMKDLYRQKGYSDEWIEKRVRGIAIREELTDEWKKRDVKGNEYGILTNEISQATFDMTPNKYKEFKGLKRENLRDHMDELELIFSMLGEKVTTEIAKVEDAQGFIPSKSAAKRGGTVAGDARKATEREIKRPVSTRENYLTEPEKKKRLAHK